MKRYAQRFEKGPWLSVWLNGRKLSAKQRTKLSAKQRCALRRRLLTLTGSEAK